MCEVLPDTAIERERERGIKKKSVCSQEVCTLHREIVLLGNGCIW
jgi:hypothetical protein